MARPKKDGVDYFPMDVDFFSDSKIKMLRARYGADGVTLYFYLLCEVYRDKGYYLQCSEDTDYLLSCELGMSIDKIRQIKSFLLGRSLFDSTLFRSVNVLSSRGIQRRYQLAVKARGSKTPVAVKEELWLLSVEETEAFIQVRPKDGNESSDPGFSKKNAAKKSKENQTKGNETGSGHKKPEQASRRIYSAGGGSSGSGKYRGLTHAPTYDIGSVETMLYDEWFSEYPDDGSVSD